MEGSHGSAIRNLLSEGVSAALQLQDYKKLSTILRFAFERVIILHIRLTDVLMLVENKEVGVMRVLVKAVVVLEDEKNNTA